MVIISKNVTLCKNILRKGFGLMFTKEGKDFAYIFPFQKTKKIAVTMYFVFYPIDILFLDMEGKIIEKVESLKPFTNYTTKKKMITFIELPKGTIQRFRIQIGDTISWNTKHVMLKK